MNILIDIGHPAHVHLYRNFIRIMQLRGHKVTVTVKNLKSAIDLLEGYGIPYIVLPSKGDTIIGKFFRQILFNFIVISLIYKNKIKIGLGSSITIAQVSRLTRMKSIIFDDDDDEVQPLFVKYAHPYADLIVSPDALKGKRKRTDTLYYAGYHELAYLHPATFTPDPTVPAKLGLKEGERYFILRFNSFKAHHDINETGLSHSQKTELVRFFEKHGRVFISTEGETDHEFIDRRLNISPMDIHSLIYYAYMFIGDSQTMTTEASVLGTPALRCNTFAGRIASMDEMEKKYGLTYSFLPKNFQELIIKAEELINMPDLKTEWGKRRDAMLKDKIDVTSFMVDLVENFPTKKVITDGKDSHK
ncbi:MAG TPA: DUF354 domain-containing protein [Bacteroidales bacterium]|nr:DUF354 domain-containing protein [Bacteroidales bacterium]HPT11008.1 DUF354 domain-containing protein [Bacteroidales bacterium]